MLQIVNLNANQSQMTRILPRRVTSTWRESRAIRSNVALTMTLIVERRRAGGWVERARKSARIDTCGSDFLLLLPLENGCMGTGGD